MSVSCPKSYQIVVTGLALSVTDINNNPTTDFAPQDSMVFTLHPTPGLFPAGTSLTLHPTNVENPNLFYTSGPTLVYDGVHDLVFTVVDLQGVNIPGTDILNFKASGPAGTTSNTVIITMHNFQSFITVNAAFQNFWALEIAAAHQTTNWTNGVLPDTQSGGGFYFFNDVASGHTIRIFRDFNGAVFEPAGHWNMVIVGNVTDYIASGPPLGFFNPPSLSSYSTTFSDFTPPDPSPWTVS